MLQKLWSFVANYMFPDVYRVLCFFWVSWGTSYFCHLFQPGAAYSLICIVFQGRMLLKTRQIVYAVPTCKVQNFVIWDLSRGNVSWAQFELQWWARTSRATNPWNITWSQHCFGARCGFVFSGIVIVIVIIKEVFAEAWFTNTCETCERRFTFILWKLLALPHL